MKKLLFISMLAIAVSSCAVSGYVPQYQENKYIGDFRPYTQQGFIISPGLEGFQYEPIALISIEISSGYTDIEVINEDKKAPVKVKSKVNNGIYENYDTETYPKLKGKNFVEADYDTILSKLVDYAKSLGADGILNCKIYRDPILTASGFAVKIKK